MNLLARFVLVGAICLVPTLAAPAQDSDEKEAPELPRGYRWEAEAKKHKLNKKDIEQLRKNKFVITGLRYKQIFEPYLAPSAPAFVTSDSLLNAFHVLFEESVVGLEYAHARKLPSVLERIWTQLPDAEKHFPGDERLLAAAQKRARIFLATARNLLDPKVFPDDAALRKVVEGEVKRVTEAKEKSKPAWLGKPDLGFMAIDYSRFKPRGFYTKSPALERYFRAVAWLQALPFRLEDDEELATLLLMKKAGAESDKERANAAEAFWRAYRVFLGSGDNWDLLAAVFSPKEMTKQGLEEVRKKYVEKATREGGPQINDQIALPPIDGKPELGFRFFSAYRLPDITLFQRTMSEKLTARDFPTGLEVSAALGSTFARKTLANKEPKVVQELDRCKILLSNAASNGTGLSGSLYAQYLECLRVLLSRTEAGSPDFMKSDAWRIKTCQTSLCGWAQLRHSWVLQASQIEHLWNGAASLPGFVEPVPEFYARFASLLERTRKVLDEAGVFESDLTNEAKRLQRAQDLMRLILAKKREVKSLSDDEKHVLNRLYDLEKLGDPLMKENADKIEKVLRKLDSYIKGVETGGVLAIEIGPEWNRLFESCKRLETLAHKQLRRVEFDGDDEKFLNHFGITLAHIMLYGGNSYLHPKDDAPRIVDVYSNSTVNKHLHVGIGKPRDLWVLYPMKGGDLLCRGAVLPYYEFPHAERLTDEAWRKLLDSPDRPQIPEWIQPIMGSDEEPAKKK